MSVSQPGIHEVLPVDACVVVLSFLDYPTFIRFQCVNKELQSLRDANGAYAERSIYSREEIFDRITWMEYRNAEITDKYDADKIEIRTLREFMKYYYGPNPVGPGKVKDHCLVPTVVPKTLKVQGIQLHHCLNVEEFLAQRPKKGSAAKFLSQTSALAQYGNARTENDELVVYLKGVYERGKTWEAQVQFLDELGDEFEKPKILRQVTVQCAHFQLTQNRAFGDRTGMEGRCTYGRTEEASFEETYHVASCGFREGRQALDPLEDPAPAELDVLGVAKGCGGPGVGVGVCVKF